MFAINSVGSSVASAAGNGATIITNPDPPDLLSYDPANSWSYYILLSWVTPAVVAGKPIIDY